MSRNYVSLGAALVLAALVFSGCASATSTPAALTSIKVQLAWTHDYSSAGFYSAEINGHFAEQRLDVELVPGGFVDGGYVEPIDEVLEGHGDFGAVSADALLEARASGKPIVAIANMIQRSPSAIISLTSSNIQTPQDLIGKTVAAAGGGATLRLNSMLKLQGIDPGKVNIIPRVSWGIDPLLNGEVDALVGWIINEGVQVREAGQEANFMLLSDYGVPDYSALIFTTEKMIQEKPDVVERFVRGFAAGLQDVIKNPEQAADYTLRYNDTLDHDQQLRRIQASIPLVQPAQTQVAMMDTNTWKDIYADLSNAGVLTEAFDVDKAYTLNFLDKVFAAVK
jgi:ABC-type nitrate/sulfonate/bicarbonate transport system substrate-binding protein